MAENSPTSSRLAKILDELKYSSFSIVYKKYIHKLVNIAKLNAAIQKHNHKNILEKILSSNIYNNLLLLFHIKRHSSNNKWQEIIAIQRQEEQDAIDKAEAREDGKQHIKDLAQLDENYLNKQIQSELQFQLTILESDIYNTHQEYQKVNYDLLLDGLSQLLQLGAIDQDFAKQIEASSNNYIKQPTLDNQKKLLPGQQLLHADFIIDSDDKITTPIEALQQECDSNVYTPFLTNACSLAENHCRKEREKQTKDIDSINGVDDIDIDQDEDFKAAVTAKVEATFAGLYLINKTFHKQKSSCDPSHIIPDNNTLLQGSVGKVFTVTSFLDQVICAAKVKHREQRLLKTMETRIDSLESKCHAIQHDNTNLTRPSNPSV